MEHMFAGRFSRHTGFLQKTVTCILLASFLLHLFQPVLLHAQDRSINDYLLPDEHLVTLAPGLDYNGRLYEIHYFTNGSLNDNKARLIGLATPESFTQQQISGLLVTADGEIVDDEETMREVFLLYRSAYFLYDVAASGPLGFTDFYPFEDFRSDLRKITANPIFIRDRQPLVVFDHRRRR